MLLPRDGIHELIAGGELLVSSSLIREKTLNSLIDLNGQCLELLAEQALIRCAQIGVFSEFEQLCMVLDAQAMARAATCPFLLLDAGWIGRKGEPPPNNNVDRYFTVQRAQKIARQLIFFSWHLAQSEGFDAQLVLGMPPGCLSILGTYTLPQINEIAEAGSAWLCPRWLDRVSFWLHLLRAAISGEFRALETARLQGLQMMAADVWDWVGVVSPVVEGGGTKWCGSIEVPLIQTAQVR